ncbi:universal stress protein [Kribbella sp. NBC_00482]|uniref:universal stress protein n=1 Tax=Kribbella sp. NBC_00482 TaxID=2975968 RepID=UPI002E17AD2F
MAGWNRTGPVVVEVDGSAENLRLVEYAAAEARRTSSRLELIAPYSSRSSFASGYSQKPVAEAADDAVQVATAHLRHRGNHSLRLTGATGEGPRSRVLAHAAQNARMLVIARSHGRGPERLVNTQVNLMLAARAGCPLVVVPASWHSSTTDRKVAVGIDGTTLSSEALEFAFMTASQRDADLIVVHSDVVAGHLPAGDDPEWSWLSRADHLLSETLTPWSSRFPDVKVTRFLSSRPPAAALVHESGDVGLVVVGAHSGPGPVDPVARRSVAAMTCPVAIVPHHAATAESANVA